MDKEEITILNEKTDEVLLDVKKSCQKFTNLVAKTAGPQGHNVALLSGGGIRITKDGISVLRNVIQPETPADHIAISTLRNASEMTNRVAGDGTTATCIVANEIFQQGYSYLTAGMNGNILRNGVMKAAGIAEGFIKDYIAKQIDGEADIRNIAKISSNGSDEIADVLTEVFSKIGKDGTARVELSKTTETTSKIVFGMSFDRGFASPYFATNEHGECVMENPLVILMNKKLANIGEIAKPMGELAKLGRPMLFITDGIDNDILNTFIVNKMKGIGLCVVQAPSWGDWKTKMLEDIAVVVGGQVISPETGKTLDMAVSSAGIIGSAKQVVVTSENTSIIADTDMNPNTNVRLAKRVESIDAELAVPGISEHDANIARIRKARLVGGVGVISVGAATEAEMHEKKDLVDDAFSSVKSALSGGWVPGAGTTFLELHDLIYQYISDNMDELNEDEIVGYRIFADAMIKPFLSIVENAGGVNAQQMLGIVQGTNRAERENDKTILPWTSGYNSNSGEVEDIVKAGIIDSAAAIINAVRNGASAGALLLTLAGYTYTPPPKPQPSLGGMM